MKRPVIKTIPEKLAHTALYLHANLQLKTGSYIAMDVA